MTVAATGIDLNEAVMGLILSNNIYGGRIKKRWGSRCIIRAPLSGNELA